MAKFTVHNKRKGTVNTSTKTYIDTVTQALEVLSNSVESFQTSSAMQHAATALLANIKTHFKTFQPLCNDPESKTAFFDACATSITEAEKGKLNQAPELMQQFKNFLKTIANAIGFVLTGFQSKHRFFDPPQTEAVRAFNTFKDAIQTEQPAEAAATTGTSAPAPACGSSTA